VFAHVCVNVCVHIHRDIHISIYVCMVCVCMCMYVYVNMYFDTYQTCVHIYVLDDLEARNRVR